MIVVTLTDNEPSFGFVVRSILPVPLASAIVTKDGTRAASTLAAVGVGVAMDAVATGILEREAYLALSMQ